MPSILDQIIAGKRVEVAERRRARPVADLQAAMLAQTPPRGFEAALVRASADGFGLIAEIKKASPSKGLIRPDFDPPAHARAYAQGGAACLSVLTDEPHFQGHADYLVAARAATPLPVLRKDFTVDPWQCLEARAMGADAVLVIVAALDDTAMAEIEDAALQLGMDVLVEVHDLHELERALRLRSRLIGVNNRDLRSFTVDTGRTRSIAAHAPAGCTLVAESGLADHRDLLALAEHGVRCFLVGEALMRVDDVAAATRTLLNG
jgi:indole-3-glycerol phosphate synthase